MTTKPEPPIPALEGAGAPLGVHLPLPPPPVFSVPLFQSPPGSNTAPPPPANHALGDPLLSGIPPPPPPATQKYPGSAAPGVPKPPPPFGGSAGDCKAGFLNVAGS